MRRNVADPLVDRTAPLNLVSIVAAHIIDIPLTHSNVVLTLDA
jgi:hypothetical protein